MRVAILTFARTNNYGATLQCYALNKYIRSLGHETIIINLPLDDGSVRSKTVPSTIVKPPVIKRIIWRLRYLLNKAKNKFFSRNKQNVCVMEPYEMRYSLSPIQREEELKFSAANMKLFDAFREKYLSNITKEYFEEEDFAKNYPSADIYVVGSDQVWNIAITRWQYPLFFLSFVKGKSKKIAYAACMGGSEDILFSKEQKKCIGKLLKGFDKISVRNQVAANILYKNFSINAKQVVDPTILLDGYEELARESDINATGSLWFDKFIINDLWLDAIRYVANQQGLDIRADRTLIRIPKIPFNPVVSVADWLRLVQTSSFVFTDSFHCTVFCILSRKQFITTPSYKGGEGRMLDLLKKLGLEDRFFFDPESVKRDIARWKTPIDYDKVYIKLNKLKEESKDFLKEALML
jgi:hypothetical protein